MSNKYDYGIYRGINHNFDYREKDRNIQTHMMYMLNRSLQMFEYENLPDTIPKRELEKILQTNGFGIFTEVNSELYILSGHLGGEQNVYGQPTDATITNIALNFNETLKIDEDCILIYSDDMAIGLVPLFARYSTILTENEITMIMASINKRTSNIFTANDDNTAKSAENYLKKLENGTLGVVMENKLYDSFKSNSMGETTTRLSELIDFHQYTKASMNNEIGLKDNINMKKERLIPEELSDNENVIFPLVDSMLSCREKALEKINEKYGTDIKVYLSSSWGNRIATDEVPPEEETATEDEPEFVEESEPEFVEEDEPEIELLDLEGDEITDEVIEEEEKKHDE